MDIVYITEQGTYRGSTDKDIVLNIKGGPEQLAMVALPDGYMYAASFKKEFANISRTRQPGSLINNGKIVSLEQLGLSANSAKPNGLPSSGLPSSGLPSSGLPSAGKQVALNLARKAAGTAAKAALNATAGTAVGDKLQKAANLASSVGIPGAANLANNNSDKAKWFATLDDETKQVLSVSYKAFVDLLEQGYADDVPEEAYKDMYNLARGWSNPLQAQTYYNASKGVSQEQFDGIMDKLFAKCDMETCQRMCNKQDVTLSPSDARNFMLLFNQCGLRPSQR